LDIELSIMNYSLKFYSDLRPKTTSKYSLPKQGHNIHLYLICKESNCSQPYHEPNQVALTCDFGCVMAVMLLRYHMWRINLALICQNWTSTLDSKGSMSPYTSHKMMRSTSSPKSLSWWFWLSNSPTNCSFVNQRSWC